MRCPTETASTTTAAIGAKNGCTCRRGAAAMLCTKTRSPDFTTARASSALTVRLMGASLQGGPRSICRGPKLVPAGVSRVLIRSKESPGKQVLLRCPL